MPFKQKSIHPAAVIWSKAALCAFLWILCIVAGARPLPTVAQTMAHKPGDQVATVRLITAPRLPDGTYDAGVEITMPPGSHTYWQQPGEAGVPPVFAFNGSVNVAKADVRFPVPSRLSEDGIDAFGYTGTVVFPVVVTPLDKTQPSVLTADVTYAVCGKICIPEHGHAVLDLTSPGVRADGAAVEAALARVPLPIADRERRDLTLQPLAGAQKPSWRVTWAGAPLEDLFAIAPEGFYVATRRDGANSFILTAERTVIAGASTRVPVSLVLKRVVGSLTATETLDVGTTSR